MPVLDWLGKDKVINHHLDVPFRFLDKKFSVGASENKIIHGDNLLALKSLLPEFAGRVKCIYIDPPYNTGNENWIYNDAVNDPQIRRWLGQVVGKEGEDLTRHDKWLCMMYPRLRLLQKLLSDDGAIFISIDDNEQANLKLICDEIFGAQNFLIQMTRVTKRSGKSTEIFAKNDDSLLVYAKSAKCKLNPFRHNDAGFKFRDEFFEQRGLYKLNQTLDYDSLQYSDSLDYPLTIDGVTYYAGSSEENFLKRKAGEHKRADWAWRWSQEKFNFGYANDFIVVKKTRNGTRIYTKTYQRATIDVADGNYFIKYSERTAPVSSLALTANEFSNDNATKDLTSIFAEKVFDYPKPVALIEFILQLATDKDSIVLDSFAGSGTTAHAVINLNAQDGGNRKFILIELNDYAETITAKRVELVGGEFDFYELGAELFDADGFINAEIPREKIFDYVYFAETQKHYEPTDEKFLLGVDEDTAYYFFDDAELNFDLLAKIRTRANSYVIYAENCTLAESELNDFHITFKKIPRDIPRL
ncbi:MAG: site-specific DNA-methyltransferase [Selenomonadaceae bacterium]|nr:site-specific DNA-methyltransferase [Selenomonadaceae bacterium]